MEAASLETLKQELSISQEDMEQWVRDVEQWAATERHGGHSSLEELQREIDEIIYSLRRKKHALYRQNDSNQTRQRKRRRLSELKRKLRERIMHYNSVAAHGEKIALEEVCSLSEDAILPWEAQGDVVSLRLKRRVFDQVMLVRRMEEEKIIIVKEMTQHCQYLRKALDNMDSLLRQTKEDIQNHTSLGELSEEGHHGLYCCLLHKRHILQQKLSTVTCTYAHVDTHSSVIFEEDMEDCEEEREQEDSTPEVSDEEL